MKKKIIAICLVVSLLAVAVIGGTLAYFTDDEAAENVFTVGNVDIELTEPMWEKEGSIDAAEVYPGEALKKDPTVTNIGKNPCFVRLQVTGWDALIEAGLSQNNITFRTDYTDNKLGDNWVLGEDGYFYYTKPLAVDESTDALFDQIVIPTDVTNGDAETEYAINVTAYAVQAQGAKPSWTDVQSMTVAEIAAWFATCMPAETPVEG